MEKVNTAVETLENFMSQVFFIVSSYSESMCVMCPQIDPMGRRSNNNNINNHIEEEEWENIYFLS